MFACSTSLSSDTNIHRKLEDGDKNEIENLRLPRRRKKLFFPSFLRYHCEWVEFGIPSKSDFPFCVIARSETAFPLQKWQIKWYQFINRLLRFFLQMKKVFKVALCCWMGRVCCKRWFMCWWQGIFLSVPWKTVGEHCSFPAPRIEAKMKLFQLNSDIALSLHRLFE